MGRRASHLSTLKEIPTVSCPRVDAARVAVDSKAARCSTSLSSSPNSSRRASLDVNVEYAIAMVNVDSSLDVDDRAMTPFGNRRDSVCGHAKAKHDLRRNMKKKEIDHPEETVEVCA